MPEREPECEPNRKNSTKACSATMMLNLGNKQKRDRKNLQNSMQGSFYWLKNRMTQDEIFSIRLQCEIHPQKSFLLRFLYAYYSAAVDS